jgi:hypothetical protein
MRHGAGRFIGLGDLIHKSSLEATSLEKREGRTMIGDSIDCSKRSNVNQGKTRHILVSSYIICTYCE